MTKHVESQFKSRFPSHSQTLVTQLCHWIHKDLEAFCLFYVSSYKRFSLEDWPWGQ